MIFMMPMPPTRSETPAILARSAVNVFCACASVLAISDWTAKLDRRRITGLDTVALAEQILDLLLGRAHSALTGRLDTEGTGTRLPPVEDTLGGGTGRDHHDVVGVQVAGLAFARQNADTAHTDIVDTDQLARRVVAVGEKLRVDIRPKQNDLGTLLLFVGAKEAALIDFVVTDIDPVRPDP
jgi:hypothetical protein